MNRTVRKLADWQPNAREAATLLSYLEPAMRYVGHWSKWGDRTPLGTLAVSLQSICHDLAIIAIKEVAAKQKDFGDEELPPVVGESYRRGLDNLRRPDTEDDANG